MSACRHGHIDRWHVQPNGKRRCVECTKAKRPTPKGGQRIPRIQFSCEVCATPIMLTPGLLCNRIKLNGPPRFCSQRCNGAARRQPGTFTTIACAQCGKSIEKPTRFVLPKNYCSHACNGAAKSREGARWKDPEQIRAYLKDYHRKHRARFAEAKRISCANRRASKRLNGGTFTTAEWLDLCACHGNRCLRCGSLGKLTVDHVVPLSQGGANVIENIQPLCGYCNRSKGTQTIDYRTSEQSAA